MLSALFSLFKKNNALVLQHLQFLPSSHVEEKRAIVQPLDPKENVCINLGDLLGLAPEYFLHSCVV